MLRLLLVGLAACSWGTSGPPASDAPISSQDLVEELGRRDPAEVDAIVARARALREARAPADEVPPVVAVELDLPPRRYDGPGPDEPDAPVVPVELDLPPLRYDGPGPDETDAPPEPAPERVAPAPEPAPRPRRPAPPDDGAVKPDLSDPKVTACTQDADCRITCAMSCCGAPCGCRSAYNVAFVAAIEKWGRRDCPADRQCPAVGCAYEPAHFAVCRDGRCRASDRPGF